MNPGNINSHIQSIDDAISALTSNQPKELDANSIIRAVEFVNSFNRKHLKGTERIKIKRNKGIAITRKILELLREQLNTIRVIAEKIKLNRQLNRKLSSRVIAEKKIKI